LFLSVKQSLLNIYRTTGETGEQLHSTRPRNVAGGGLQNVPTPELATTRGLEACALLRRTCEVWTRPRRTIFQRISDGIERGAEIVLASVTLVVAAPLMLIIAAIVKLDTPGPALFGQIRVGRNGRLFRFWKFRTLYADAKARFPELYSYEDEIRHLRVKRGQDPRVTPVGRWLRRSTLDELPNFWNVLKGEVALVGPRPELPEMVPHYMPEQLIKFRVKPGVTGLAQSNGRANLAFQETIAYDIEYVKNKSLWLDVKIIVKTLMLLARFDGAF
jgi:lipopolysaccharide/colanic/teichoic acid biosynthesis glycosyltransferase